MEAEIEDIINKSLEKAQEHDKVGNVGKAYAYYTVVAELCPQQRLAIQEVFTDVLCQWGLQLAADNRFQDVLQCYERSLELFPNNVRMLNNFAAHLLRHNEPMKAVTYLKKALKNDPMFLPAERNLQNAYSMAVDRWHFTMLNDKQRNSAYEQAIYRRISNGYDTVLDIGAGTGLLSLYAKDAGAQMVYSCECSSEMIDIARKVFACNNAEDIKLIPKYSWDIRIPDDIPVRVKLVITETFDAGLFGELVLPSLIEAHKNILEPNGTGVVIPRGACLYTAAIECEYIRHRSSVVFETIQRICPLNFENISVLPDDESYDSESLHNVKIKYLTDPNLLLKINFNELSELEEFIKDGIKGVVRGKCDHDGIIDGLVTWFKLYLDEDITLNSSDQQTCWQFAVFPSTTMACCQGDMLEIIGEMSDGKLKCYYTAKESIHQKKDKLLYRLPREVITFLNDTEYIESLIEISRIHKDRMIKNVLDTSPFPIYGLMLLMENKNTETLYCQTDNVILCSLIEKMVEHHGLQGKVVIVSTFEEICCQFDTIIVHNFDMKGELRDWGQENYREFFGPLLKPSGILLPEKISLVGQLVYSEEIPKMVVVDDRNIQRKLSSANSNVLHEKNNCNGKNEKFSRYIIAEYINEFKIEQVFDINTSIYTYKPLSDIKVLITMDEEHINSVTNFGKIDDKKKPLPNVLLYWYKVQLTPEHIHDTNRNKSFMNHAAILLENDLREVIAQNKEVNIMVHHMKGLIKVQVLKP